jgi:hypothetical protein
VTLGSLFIPISPVIFVVLALLAVKIVLELMGIA